MKQLYPSGHLARHGKSRFWFEKITVIAQVASVRQFNKLIAICLVGIMLPQLPVFGSSVLKAMAPPTALEFDDRSGADDGAIQDNSVSGKYLGMIDAIGGAGPFTYSLVTGDGDTDNALFMISGDSLYAAQFIDLETHPTPGNLSIRVRAEDTDNAGFEQIILLAINDVDENTTSDFGAPSDEFLVNKVRSNIQQQTAVAQNASGAFVVVWQEQTDGVFAQRYNAGASPVGNVLRVDNQNNNNQQLPDVAMADNGDFVVVWQGTGNAGGSGVDVIGRLYAADGTPGSEFIVNTVTAGDQSAASVAMNAAGAFIIAWEGSGGADPNGIYVRQFAADGTPTSSQFPVNTTIANAQVGPSTGIADNGNFVVSWQSTNQVDIASEGDIYFQRFNSAGTAVGGETLVNTVTAGDQIAADVAMNGGGAFVIVWQGPNAADLPNADEIYGQRYNANGTVNGVEFAVNTSTNNNQFTPSVAMADDGTFVVAFTGPGSGNEVYARRFNADGSGNGNEFEVNKFRLNTQRFPSIAMDGEGGFLVAWEGSNVGGGNYDIYARRYYVNAAPTAIGLDNQTIANGTAIGTPVGTLTTTDPDAEDQFGYALVAGAGADDNATFMIQDNQLLTAELIEEATLPASFNVRVRSTDALGKFVESTFTIDVAETEIPVIATNAGLTVAQGDTATLAQAALEVTDAESGPEALTFTITQVPVNGVLQKDGVDIEASGTFTQQEINNGLITYIHDNSVNLSDSLKFTVNDGVGGVLAEINFAITITASDNTLPVIATNAGISVPIGDTVAVSQNALEVTDEESAPEAIIYTLVSIPATGSLQKNEVALAVNETFTQADINSGAIIYIHDGGESTTDGFSFTVADEDGGATAETAVAITITPAGTPTANAGPDQIVTTAGDTANVTLNGTASSDEDGTIVSYLWSENDEALPGGDVAQPTVALAVGMHTIALTVTDDAGLTASDTVMITVNVGDNTDPVVATNAVLNLPQQGDTVAITQAELEVTDAESNPEAITYTLTQVPANGSLQRDGTDLAAAGTFTQQDINDGLISYANSGASEASDSFSFTVADGNGGAIAETQFMITINVVTAIGDGINDKVVVVYPNPSQQSLYIKMDGVDTFGDIQVNVSNSMGQLFKSVQLNARELAQHPIDISNLTRGTYFVRIKTGNQTIIKKLIKE
ncbi:MAG: cadherin-like domain-containing protein [Cyclobacteriaceae bacterium]